MYYNKEIKYTFEIGLQKFAYKKRSDYRKQKTIGILFQFQFYVIFIWAKLASKHNKVKAVEKRPSEHIWSLWSYTSAPRRGSHDYRNLRVHIPLAENTPLSLVVPVRTRLFASHLSDISMDQRPWDMMFM